MPDDAYKSLISIKRPDECWGVWKDEVLSCVCPEQTLFCRCYCSGLASDLFGSGSGRSSSMRIRRAGLSVSSNCPESDMRKKIQTASAITPRLMMMRRGRTSMVFDCRLPHRPAGWIATLASRARNDGLLSSPRGASFYRHCEEPVRATWQSSNKTVTARREAPWRSSFSIFK